MGSEIQLKSTYEQGSDFYFSINVPAIEKDLTQKIHLSSEKKLAVLLDDIEVNHKVLSGLLEKWNIDVIHARRPSQALDVIKDMTRNQEKLDYLILDYMMPEMNGLNF